jgi:hypothetical protein
MLEESDFAADTAAVMRALPDGAESAAPRVRTLDPRLRGLAVVVELEHAAEPFTAL